MLGTNGRALTGAGVGFEIIQDVLIIFELRHNFFPNRRTPGFFPSQDSFLQRFAMTMMEKTSHGGIEMKRTANLLLKESSQCLGTAPAGINQRCAGKYKQHGASGCRFFWCRLSPNCFLAGSKIVCNAACQRFFEPIVAQNIFRAELRVKSGERHSQVTFRARSH